MEQTFQLLSDAELEQAAGGRGGISITVNLPNPIAVVGHVVQGALGVVGGVFLAFTDAVALGRHIAYLAVAEDTPDGIADGAIHGAGVGILRDGGARWDVLAEADGSASKRKVEGIALDAAGGGWLLTDPDDAKQPAELCRVELKF